MSIKCDRLGCMNLLKRAECRRRHSIPRHTFGYCFANWTDHGSGEWLEDFVCITQYKKFILPVHIVLKFSKQSKVFIIIYLFIRYTPLIYFANFTKMCTCILTYMRTYMCTYLYMYTYAKILIYVTERFLFYLPLLFRNNNFCWNLSCKCFRNTFCGRFSCECWDIYAEDQPNMSCCLCCFPI